VDETGVFEHDILQKIPRKNKKTWELSKF